MSGSINPGRIPNFFVFKTVLHPDIFVTLTLDILESKPDSTLHFVGRTISFAIVLCRK
jgi:hypothetical protein